MMGYLLLVIGELKILVASSISTFVCLGTNAEWVGKTCRKVSMFVLFIKNPSFLGKY